MSGDHNEHQKPYSYLDFECPRCGHCCQQEHMKEEWLMPGAVVPVDAETTAALVGEIKRMMHIVGEMALNQRYPWVGLTDEEIAELHHEIKVRLMGTYKTEDIYRAIEAKLKEKNNA